MDGNDLLQLGFRPGKALGLALQAVQAAADAGASQEDVLNDLADVCGAPADYLDDPIYGRVAEALSACERHRARIINRLPRS